MRKSVDLPALLTEAGRSGRPAIRTPDLILTYGELVDRVRETAACLKMRGIGSRDRVVLAFGNGPEAVVATLAVLWVGAIAVPVDPAAGEHRLAAVIDTVRPALVLTPSVGVISWGGEVLALDLEAGRLHFHPTDLVSPSGCEAPVTVSPEAPAFIRFSSGSTGQPKGVVLDHGAMNRAAALLSREFGLRPGHRELLLTSMAYSGAWQRVAAVLWQGGCLHLPEPPLTASGLGEDVKRWRIDGVFVVPPLLHVLMTDEAVLDDLARLRQLEIGSAPVNASVLRALMERLPATRILVHYGLTECPRAALLDVRACLDRLDTVGRPVTGVRIRIVDIEGRPSPPGTSGEIQVRGPQQARGYWRGDGALVPLGPDGWVATGDEGRLDEDGFLTWLGRSDDRINCGGHSYFPAEVEVALGPVSGVRDYLIVGFPDTRGVLGQVPWAFVVPVEDGPSAVRHFIRQARRRLPPYQMPRRVVPVAELPLTPSGKPDRRQLVGRYAYRGSTHGTG